MADESAPRIWVLLFETKQGNVFYAYSTEAPARARVVKWARDGWNEDWEDWEGEPDDMDDHEVVQTYFENMDGDESYEIDSTLLDVG